MLHPNSHNSEVSLKTCSAVFRGLKTAWLETTAPADASTQKTATLKEQQKPVVMLLHGFPDSPLCWDMQFSTISQLGHLIAPWIRGAGGSEPAKDISRYGSDAIALDHMEILQLVDPTAKRKVVLIGHDLGGVHAINLARLLGKRCAGLVIINSLDLAQMSRRLMSSPSQILKSWYIAAMQIPLLPESLLGKFERRFLSGARNKGGLPENLQPDCPENFGNVTGPLNQYRAFARELSASDLFTKPKLKIPTLILWGQEDAFLDPPTQDEMEMVAEKPVIRILKGNHWLHRERADTVNDLVKNFTLGLDL